MMVVLLVFRLLTYIVKTLNPTYRGKKECVEAMLSPESNLMWEVAEMPGITGSHVS